MLAIAITTSSAPQKIAVREKCNGATFIEFAISMNLCKFFPTHGEQVNKGSMAEN